MDNKRVDVLTTGIMGQRAHGGSGRVKDCRTLQQQSDGKSSEWSPGVPMHAVGF